VSFLLQLKLKVELKATPVEGIADHSRHSNRLPAGAGAAYRTNTFSGFRNSYAGATPSRGSLT
jgi:hypothetical protein